jgi:hypothetical protein
LEVNFFKKALDEQYQKRKKLSFFYLNFGPNIFNFIQNWAFTSYRDILLTSWQSHKNLVETNYQTQSQINTIQNNKIENKNQWSKYKKNQRITWRKKTNEIHNVLQDERENHHFFRVFVIIKDI